MLLTSGHNIVMIRHAIPGKRKRSYDALRLVDIGRQATVGFGPDRAETMIPWLKCNLPAHRPPWMLCVRFRREQWIHCIPSNEDLVAAERLAHCQDLQVLTVWFEQNENRTCARLYKKGKLAGELVLAGKGDDAVEVISFKSSAHTKTFLKRCTTLGDAIHGFLAAVDSNIRGLAVIEANSSLQLVDSEGRPFDAGEVDELAITYYAVLTGEENPASVRLQSAIESGDVEAARQAIADGASPEFLPDGEVSPLSIAFDPRYPGDWRGVGKLLVEAGAPIDGYHWEDPPVCSMVNPLSREDRIIESIEALLALGADINSASRHPLHRGSTSLHLAVFRSFPEVTHFLIQKGASLDARNDDGQTPLELAEFMAKDDPDVEVSTSTLGDASNTRKRRRRHTLIELLAWQMMGTPEENVKRRKQVVKVLRAASKHAHHR